MKTLFVAVLAAVIFTVAVAADTQNNGGTGNIIFASQNGDVHHHGDTYQGKKIKVSRHGYATPVPVEAEEGKQAIKPAELHQGEGTVIYKDREGLPWWLLFGLLVGIIAFALYKRGGKNDPINQQSQTRDTDTDDNIVDAEFEVVRSLPAGSRGQFPRSGDRSER
jgi:opacity protein-like surface antigen